MLRDVIPYLESVTSLGYMLTLSVTAPTFVFDIMQNRLKSIVNAKANETDFLNTFVFVIVKSPYFVLS